jgi:uncharacterized membrane protein YesL
MDYTNSQFKGASKLAWSKLSERDKSKHFFLLFRGIIMNLSFPAGLYFAFSQHITILSVICQSLLYIVSCFVFVAMFLPLDKIMKFDRNAEIDIMFSGSHRFLALLNYLIGLIISCAIVYILYTNDRITLSVIYGIVIMISYLYFTPGYKSLHKDEFMQKAVIPPEELSF